MSKRKRFYGDKLDFKSLSCAPVNEQGVVYLFGVLHEYFDFKIEAIQTGFPDCIARRLVSKGRWEELRIEFEFESKSFYTHGHDLEGADIIICWEHNWKDCPENIEVIELLTIIKDLEEIQQDVKTDKQLTDYQEFCREMRLQGLTFKEIAPLWNAKKTIYLIKPKKSSSSKNTELTPYQGFMKEKIQEGNTMAEAAKLWKKKIELKSNNSGYN
jgi:hypothetical protein